MINDEYLIYFVNNFFIYHLPNASNMFSTLDLSILKNNLKIIVIFC